MERAEGESYDDYRKRRKQQQKNIKSHLRGRWYHISSVLEHETKIDGEGKEIVAKDLPPVRKTKTYKRPEVKPKIIKKHGRGN